MVITICGSARFRDEINATQVNLTLQGHLVFTIEDLTGVDVTDEIKSMLALNHLRKIDLSDAIYVINVDGYIGESAANEIEYAKSIGNEILYLEQY